MKILEVTGTMMNLYRAGGPTARYGGGPTFYSTTPEGAAPYATRESGVANYQVPVNRLFDTRQGNNYELYKKFLTDTGHPGGFGKNMNPFWTTEPELAEWLKTNNIPFDAIKFDENTGHPSIAVYHNQARQVAEDITVNPTGVTVGTAGADSFILHQKPLDDAVGRREERPDQVGYKIRIGRRTIPTPGYNPGDASGVVGTMVRS